VADTSGQKVKTWWPTSGDTTRALVLNVHADFGLRLDISPTDGKWGLITRNYASPTETFPCMSTDAYAFANKSHVSGTTYFLVYYTRWPAGTEGPNQIPGYGRPFFFNGGQVGAWLGRDNVDTVHSVQLGSTVYKMGNAPLCGSTRMVLGFRFNANNTFSYCSSTNPRRTITTFRTSADFTQIGNKLDFLGQVYGGSFPCARPVVGGTGGCVRGLRVAGVQRGTQRRRHASQDEPVGG
jgi:hypothetical protein